MQGGGEGEGEWEWEGQNGGERDERHETKRLNYMYNN